MPDFANLGGAADITAERISALHMEKNPALIRQLKAQFASNVNVNVRGHNQERQTAFETYLTTTEMASPIAGQPPLQGLIDAGNVAGAAGEAIRKRDAAITIKAQLEANQETRKTALRKIGNELENEIKKIIPNTDTRSTVNTEVRGVIAAKDAHLNKLRAAKNAAVANVNALYTAANKKLLKDAYGIGDAEVAQIQSRHVQNIKDEYEKQINNAEIYLNKLRDDFLKSEAEIEKNFRIRQVWGKFFEQPIEGGALAAAGGERTLEEMKRDIDEATTFTINVAPDKSFKNLWGLFDTSSPEVKIHKSPDGKLMIALDDINPSSIEALLDIAQAQGKTTININFDPSDPKNKDKEERAKAMVAWAAAVRGMKTTGTRPFSLEALRRLSQLREQQRYVRDMISNQEARRAESAGEGLIFIEDISRRIQGKKAAIESLSNEFRSLAAAPDNDARFQAMANEIVASRDRILQELNGLRDRHASPNQIAAKELELANIRAIEVASMPPGNPAEIKNCVLFAKYNKIKTQRNELSELIQNQFSGLASLRGDVNRRISPDSDVRVFDTLSREHQQTILNALREGYGSINDGVRTEKRLHEIPAGEGVQSLKEIINGRATARPGGILDEANADMTRFHTDTAQYHESVAQDEQPNLNNLQARVPADAPAHRPR